MIMTSRLTPCLRDSTTMRANRGSIGRRERSRPTFVSAGVPSGERTTAPSSVSRSTPSLMPRESGGCRNGNAAMSPRPSDTICRITAARFVRRISGSVNSGRRAKSSSEYRRIAMPSLVRPERPERWFADACEIASMGRRCTLERTE